MPVKLSEPRLVVQTEDLIGEVPLWNTADQALTWIDIFKPAFHRLHPATGTLESFTPPEKLGSYALCRDGRVLTAGRGGIGLWTPGSGAFERLSTPESDRPDNILNDGRTDARGRFFVASMDKMIAGPNGRMWRVTAQNGTELVQDGEIWLPNSFCFSPDGSTFYYGDSKTDHIIAADYDLETGEFSNPRLFADTSSLPGGVDGSSVDLEGFLWNARFDGGCLIRFAPDGKVDQIVKMPVSKPAHVTFGGADLKTMYVTTARFRMKPEQLAAEPMAGGLFSMESDVAGLPEPFWG